MRRPVLKICGNTNPTDSALVGSSTADYCGILVDVAFSERSLMLDQAIRVARESNAKNVILLCNPSLQLAEQVACRIAPHAIQLLCQETPDLLAQIKAAVPCEVWKTIHLSEIEGQAPYADYVAAGADALLVDSADTSEGFLRMGGTGRTTNWTLARDVVDCSGVPVFLAGGITPANVVEAIERVRPHGIDLCSGVEASKGKKDPRKVQALIESLASLERKKA